ncbi:MAG: hypothetical protein R3344_05795 [Acidobacteriota bacterium]|nr:hypothetical protein [Acidobacteriota bacterium]
MSRRYLSPRRLRRIAGVGLVAMAFGTLIPCPSGPRNDRETRLIMESNLRQLWSGTPEQRVEAAERAGLIVAMLESEPPDPDLMSSDEIVAGLTNVVAMEPDDFVLSRLINTLVRSVYAESPLASIFLDALRHHSPNVRGQAVRHFTFAGTQTEEARPVLEKMWRGDRDRWYRADLMVALARHGSTRFLGDFIELAGSGDEEATIDAVRALAELDLPEATGAIAQLADSGSERLAHEVLWALTPRVRDENALAGMLRLTRSSHLTIRVSATMMLREFRQEPATFRLVEIVKSPDEIEVVFSALCGLEEREHPVVIPALMTVSQDRGFTGPIAGRATDVLAARGIGAADPIKDPRFRPLPCQISRYWFQGSDRYRIDGGPERESGVCRERPGGERHGEMSDGQVSFVHDFFEHEGRLWVRVGASSQRQCWLPEHELERIDGGLRSPKEWAPWKALRD